MERGIPTPSVGNIPVLNYTPDQARHEAILFYSMIAIRNVGMVVKLGCVFGTATSADLRNNNFGVEDKVFEPHNQARVCDVLADIVCVPRTAAQIENT